jgi:hypothetical protein
MNAVIEGKVTQELGKGLSTEDYTNDEKEKLATVEYNANCYTHPEDYTTYDEGLYKVEVDKYGHVSGATPVEQSDIIDLGFPTQTAFSELSEAFEEYKKTNNEAVSGNTSEIVNNKSEIEAIKKDYLQSTDKTELQNSIAQVSGKANDNATAIGEVEEDLTNYKQEISKQFDGVNTAIEDDKAAIEVLQGLVGEDSVSEQIGEAIANTTVAVGSTASSTKYQIKVTVNGVEAKGPAMSLVRFDENQTELTDAQKQQARTNIGAISYKDIYVQEEEPTDTPHGTLWIDLDDELETWTWGDY